ncbi:hypothetical protein PL921460080 [Planktothrix tepida PCC 9214]|uniref:Uncharacterized protein n=1 Tax=Planktothrix tepida PCC 9214 TaxID=671072 RepID=A0A1J1LNA0_9CYAN|nr:hypothetical protein PL921460080 [Planktothrix tepida PCC 9214]
MIKMREVSKDYQRFHGLAKLKENGWNTYSFVGSLDIPLGKAFVDFRERLIIASANGFSEPRKPYLDSRWCLGLR